MGESLAFTHDDAKKGTQLMEVIDIGKSPFKIKGNKEVGYAGTFGKYRITEYYETPDEVKKWVDENMIEFICLICFTVYETMEEFKLHNPQTVDKIKKD